MWKNIGEMQNQGWEIGINYNIRTGQVQHGFSLNLSDSYNKVLKFNLYRVFIYLLYNYYYNNHTLKVQQKYGLLLAYYCY